ncbi:MAG TPA: hypothetical protein ENI87_03510 [bacterium]|nr:hypothetical protein [bacterium]
MAQSVRVQAGPDPYTGGKPEALRKLGYVSLGPFPLGSGYDTRSVERLLGTEPLVWIETAHFRLGAALSAVPLKGRQEWSKEWKALVRAELEELRHKLPNLKKRVKTLDPWLRAHLFAHRLERLYADVLGNLGCTDESFPQSADDPASEGFRGLGPYLGMREKFVVLLFDKGSSQARYTKQWQGREIAQPIRYHDQQFGCMFWSGSQETAEGLFRIDLALYAHVTFNVAHNLYTCYRSYCHDLPPWLVTGLAHWHARKVSPRFPTYDRRSDDDTDTRSVFWDWPSRVKGLVKHDVFEPLERLIDRDNAGEFGIEQHMQAWALVDFLMATRKRQLSCFLHRLKDPFHERRKMPSRQELATRQHDALREAFGMGPAELDVEWRAYVKESKPKRRR